MLKLVGRSYAMANADQAVKDIAQQIIGDNNTSTVLDTIAKLISPKN
jgi:hydroxymethylpyrimidine pyrophosphatase-like HAD family hydrolase